MGIIILNVAIKMNQNMTRKGTEHNRMLGVKWEGYEDDERDWVRTRTRNALTNSRWLLPE